MNTRYGCFCLKRLRFAAAMMWLIGSGLSHGVTNDHVVSFLAGPLVGFGTRAATYSWSFSYMEGFADRWAWSVSKLNEGHDDDHHRDGTTVQLWRRCVLDRSRLLLAAGLGPHLYCDTTDSDLYEQGYENNHGLGLVLSALARWQAGDRWWLEARANGVLNDDCIRTAALLVGAGYTFEPVWTGAASARPSNVHLNEVTLLAGANIINSFGSETGGSCSFEYRRYLLPWLNATITALHEGAVEQVNRQGLAPQVWWGRHFSNGRISMGVGVGPYFSVDTHRTDQPQLDGDFSVSGLLSYSAAYHFDAGPLLRMTWHRVATAYDYNRDSDIILIGVGYGF